MNYRTLGRTGLRVSEVGLGTMVHAGHFGAMDDAESLGAISAALELGVNLIDTSNAYGDGYSETLLGKALQGKRDHVMLATKGGNIMTGPQRGTQNFSPDYIAQVMDESLKRLQTDYVDLYQLHNPKVPDIQNDDLHAMLERRKAQGKVRFLGVSVNTMEEGIAAVKGGRYDVIQIEHNILIQEPERDVFPLAQQANVGIIARVPLRRGLLSGKISLKDRERFTGGDVRARLFAGEALEKELAKVEQVRFVVKPPITSLAQAAIAYCLAHPAVSTVIPGARNAEQMRVNASASGSRLPEADVARLRELWRTNFT
jgi:aryl-alcohol dehydrogenase-like predicted oxidoreductase